jgi:chemotaxis protein CheZ
MSDHTSLEPKEAFERLGQITRQLHQAMVELGFDTQLQRIAGEIPDARDRLAYVGEMTNSAAHKVLGLVEQTLPDIETLRAEVRQQRAALAPLLEGAAATPALQQGLQLALDFGDRVENTAKAQDQALNEIMLSQSFQDLSGQVIKKVIDMISRTETQLLQLLSQSAPEHLAAAAEAANEQLQGPQTPDKALKQDDVDDLLASLGF